MKNLLALSVATAALAGWSTVAEAVPNTLSFAGRLSDANGPVTGSVKLEVELYDSKANGTLIWEETHFAVTVDGGLLYATLGSVDPTNNALDLSVFTGNELYLQVLVNDEELGPRAAINSVPYAQHAARAELLGDLGPADVQRRITGQCSAGSTISAIAANGTVSCEADANTTYQAGAGLALGGTTFSVDTAVIQSRVAQTCNAGSSIRAITATGSVTCENDDSNTYTAGAGLSLNGGQFSANFDSNGTSAQVARADHLHDTRYLQEVRTNPGSGLNVACVSANCTLSVDPTDFNGSTPINTTAPISSVGVSGNTSAFTELGRINFLSAPKSGRVLVIATVRGRCIGLSCATQGAIGNIALSVNGGTPVPVTTKGWRVDGPNADIMTTTHVASVTTGVNSIFRLHGNCTSQMQCLYDQAQLSLVFMPN